MSGKIIKTAIFSLVAIMLLSMIFPGGVSSGLNHEVNKKILYGMDNKDGHSDRFHNPEFRIEKPKLTWMVMGENGEKTLIDIPNHIGFDEIGGLIKEKMQDESLEDEDLNGWDSEDTEKPKENPFLEQEYNGVYLVKNALLDSEDGFLFCNINEPLSFNASYLTFGYHNISYKWDVDSDGTYDLVSSSPSISHIYNEFGIYRLKIKITYSYNYTYYPVYGGDIVYYNRPVTGIDIPDESGCYIYPISTTTVQRNDEYEIKVSVGSKEKGYPPILDFELRNGDEEESPWDKVGDQYPIILETTQVKMPDENSFIRPEPITINPVIIYPPIPRTSSNVTIVCVKEVRNRIEDPPKFDECEIKFDASKTKDINENSIFSWDFGDGESGEGMEITHIYTHKGTYTATLQVKGWDCPLSKTLIIRRGSQDPKHVIINHSWSYMTDDYLIRNVNETMILDIDSLIYYGNFEWIEWDFDNDGIYEENCSVPWIEITFSEPGYYEVNFKYTYTTKGDHYRWYRLEDGTSTYKIVNPYYTSRAYWIKVIVLDKNNNYPLIPDFIINAPNMFSWWHQIGFLKNIDNTIERKNYTNLRCYDRLNNRLGAWNNPITFNATTTLLPVECTYDDFNYFWDFGDGTTGEGLKVEHNFAANRDYSVKLTIEKGNFNISISKTVRSRAYSPNIYLYRETPGYDTISVMVDGRVTKTVPKVELGSEIVWENIWIEDGKIFYKDKNYDFLYYEELLNKPSTSEFGWMLERNQHGRLFLNKDPITLEELNEFFRGELTKAGLFENEIEDFIVEWLGEGARLFPAQKSFRYALMYIPQNQVDDLIQIKTKNIYDEIIRFHLLIQPAEKGVKLLQPLYPEHKSGANILHEWGVYSGESILRNTKTHSQVAEWDNLFYGNTEYQTDWVCSRSFKEEENDHLLSTVSSRPGPRETISTGTFRVFSRYST